MRTSAFILAMSAATLSSAGAHAQSEAVRARDLAATCANCHGTGGKSQGIVPTLAGKPKAELVQKMNNFRDGKSAATIMHQLAKGYTAEQIDLLAGWLAQQKP